MSDNENSLRITLTEKQLNQLGIQIIKALLEDKNK